MMKLLRRFFDRGRRSVEIQRVEENTRVYAIGDIHGRSDLLAEMERLIIGDLDAYPPPKNVLTVFLGDYVDRGLDSHGVISRLSADSFPTPVVFIRGNHEAMMLASLADPTTCASWLRNGGLETLYSYGVNVAALRGDGNPEAALEELRARLPEQHLEFLRGTRDSHTSGNYFFCHAGIRPGIPLAAQVQHDLLWIREEFLSCAESFEKLVVHGHTPVLTPEVRPNRINIDTGAYISGRLTGIVLEGEERRFISAVLPLRPGRR